MEAKSAPLSGQRTQQSARIEQGESEPERKRYCRSEGNRASPLQPRKRAHIDQDELDQPKAKRYCHSENGVASPRPRSPSADRSLKVSPTTSPEPEVKGASVPYPEAGPQGDDGDSGDDRLQNTVGENPIAGKGFKSTESAPQTLNSRPRPQSHTPDQESSRLNTLKADNKDTLREYRCPHCSFICWLCSSAIGGKGIDLTESDSSDSDDDASDSRDEDEINIGRSKRRKRPDGLIYLDPTDENFDQLILVPVGARVLNGNRRSQPEELPNDGIQDDPGVVSSVFPNIDYSNVEEISNQIISYLERGYNKTTLARLVSKYIMPLAPYTDPLGPQAVVPLWREKWTPRKEGPVPPPENGYIYDWDFESDLTYMVAINLFESDLRIKLQTKAPGLLAERFGVCPYLTYELKDTGLPGEDCRVRGEISAASVLWLFRRKELREKLGSSDFSDLRHYAIVVNSVRYQIWEAGFDGSKYSVQMIARGSLDGPEGVLQFAKWSNAIHKWGLGPNARAFKRDVETLLERGMIG